MQYKSLERNGFGLFLFNFGLILCVRVENFQIARQTNYHLPALCVGVCAAIRWYVWVTDCGESKI